MPLYGFKISDIPYSTFHTVVRVGVLKKINGGTHLYGGSDIVGQNEDIET
jgi:hypothetical protein